MELSQSPRSCTRDAGCQQALPEVCCGCFGPAPLAGGVKPGALLWLLLGTAVFSRRGLQPAFLSALKVPSCRVQHTGMSAAFLLLSRLKNKIL